MWVNRPVYGYLVAFRTYPDTLAGAAQAQRVAANVQATLDAHGVKGLEAAAHRPRPIRHHRSTRPGERTVTDPTETQHFLHTLVYLCTFGVPILMALTWLGTESYLHALDAKSANAAPRAGILSRLAPLLPARGRDGGA